MAARLQLRAVRSSLKSAPTVCIVGGLLEPPGYFKLVETAIHKYCKYNTFHFRYPARSARYGAASGVGVDRH